MAIFRIWQVSRVQVGAGLGQKTKKLKYQKSPKPPGFYGFGNRYLSALHARLRNGCSALRSDLFHANLVQNCQYTCGMGPETAKHYLLECARFRIPRVALMGGLERLNVQASLPLLLCGSENMDSHTNTEVFKLVQTFIKDSGRFSEF